MKASQNSHLKQSTKQPDHLPKPHFLALFQQVNSDFPTIFPIRFHLLFSSSAVASLKIVSCSKSVKSQWEHPSSKESVSVKDLIYYSSFATTSIFDQEGFSRFL